MPKTQPRQEEPPERARIIEEHRWINVGAGGERQGHKEPSLQHPIFIEDPHKKTCMAHKTQLRTKEPESEYSKSANDGPLQQTQ